MVAGVSFEPFSVVCGCMGFGHGFVAVADNGVSGVAGVCAGVCGASGRLAGVFAVGFVAIGLEGLPWVRLAKSMMLASHDMT